MLGHSDGPLKLAEIYPNASHARTYNRVAIKLYLFPGKRENIDKTRGKEIWGKEFGYAGGRY